MPKKLKGLKTGFFERGLSIAKLTIQAGANAAGYSIGNLLEGKSDSRRTGMLKQQMALLADQFGELKGSLMKVGQMLSVYGEHFLPPEANQFLKALHFESPPLAWSAIEKHLNRQLGKEALQALTVDQEPLAAASLGQVHRAVINKSKREIVLKIQYPGVEDAIDGDIRALKRLLSMANFLPQLPETDTLFEEIKAMLLQELDYKLEAKTLTEVSGQLDGDKRYLVPEVFPEFCAKRVIAMSYEGGVRLDGAEVLALSQERRNALGEAMLDLYFREIFQFKAVQTDPHFGNYRVRLGKSGDLLVLYDFGAVRRFPDEFVGKYRNFIGSLFVEDRPAYENATRALGILEDGDSQEMKDDFWTLGQLIMEPFAKKFAGTYDWNGHKLAQRVASHVGTMASRHRLHTPPRELVFLDRKVAGVFTSMAVLKCDFSGRGILEKYL